MHISEGIFSPERSFMCCLLPFADVYPYLRTVSRTLGLDFGSVDMRWGVREETSYEHGTLEMCLREVDR